MIVSISKYINEKIQHEILYTMWYYTKNELIHAYARKLEVISLESNHSIVWNVKNTEIFASVTRSFYD